MNYNEGRPRKVTHSEEEKNPFAETGIETLSFFLKLIGPLQGKKVTVRLVSLKEHIYAFFTSVCDLKC